MVYTLTDVATEWMERPPKAQAQPEKRPAATPGPPAEAWPEKGAQGENQRAQNTAGESKAARKQQQPNQQQPRVVPSAAAPAKDGGDAGAGFWATDAPNNKPATTSKANGGARANAAQPGAKDAKDAKKGAAPARAPAQAAGRNTGGAAKTAKPRVAPPPLNVAVASTTAQPEARTRTACQKWLQAVASIPFASSLLGSVLLISSPRTKGPR